MRKEASDVSGEEGWRWVAVISATLLTSAIAFLITGARCGATGVVLGRSAYCRTVNAPGLASSPIGIALEFVLFGLPSLVAVMAALHWAITRRPRFVTAVTVYCAATVALSLVLLVVAHVQYPPLD